MAIISCPECGKQVSDRAVSCPDCGCPISAVPSAVSVSVEKEVEKLLILARRAREGSDSKNAKKYYDQILDKDPGNWEAIFFSVYYEASECKIRDISSAANSVANTMFSTFSAIADLENEEEIDKALKTVTDSALVISVMFTSSSINHYNQFSSVNNAFGECSGRVVSSGQIYFEIEESYKKVFPNKKKELADHQKLLVGYMSGNARWYNKTYLANQYTRLGQEIQTVYPDYAPPAPPAANSGGCYVATAVYGSYDCPEVWTLRRFRDNTLASTWYGRGFIRTYYTISPTLVKWFGKSEWFKNMWKPTLDKMVSNLRDKGVENTPYDDKNW